MKGKWKSILPGKDAPRNFYDHPEVKGFGIQKFEVRFYVHVWPGHMVDREVWSWQLGGSEGASHQV